MKRKYLANVFIFRLFLAVGLSAINVAGQAAAKETEVSDSFSSPTWIFILVIVAAALGCAVYFWRKSKKGDNQPQFNYASRYQNYYSNESFDIGRVDAEKELEWLRKAKQSTPKQTVFTPVKKENTVRAKSSLGEQSGTPDELKLDTKMFQEKMRKLQYAQLPINSFNELTASKGYAPLELSSDPSLISAIEQANEEYEEDESVRDLALRILTAFRTRNSVEALSQIALYDLSSNLRSKAVASLTDFDHESVFEAMLLACADPTREVRAAASRGLFRLNFNRADAWKRIIETNDEFRMSHAARAAIESGIVVKSFDRLTHDDLKVAYEAFVLVSLLVKAGETTDIFEAIRTHKDERVKFALVHVLGVNKDERTLVRMRELTQSSLLSPEVSERIEEAISKFECVVA